MRAFKRRLVSLNVFSATYRNVPLLGTDKVVVPYYELDTTTSNTFLAATGYEFNHDTSTGSREVTIDKRKYKPLTFSSSELMRQPYFSPPTSMMLMAEQLGVDVWLDVLSLITDDNYPNVPVFENEPGNMDVDSVIDIAKKCDDADWPEVGRALVLGTGHKAALLKDDSVKHYLNIGSTDPVRNGATGRLGGFELFYSPRIPTNNEDLAGFACMQSAALVVTAPVAPAPGVRQSLLSYDLVVDPETGIAFEYRYWGEAQMDKDREIVECNYGYAKGNSDALRRITSGATAMSSSSSVSSVNSSSSSST
jgi:hypothetical protein